MHTQLMDAYVTDDRLRSPRFLKRVHKDGEYWFKAGTSRLFIPEDAQLKSDILVAHHDQLLSGHMGIDKTIAAISSKFWWPGLSKDVYDHVTTCTKCQAVNARSRKREGQLCPLPIPEHPWQQIFMDFITGMPPTPDGHDATFVIIDHLTKMVLVYFVNMSIDAPTVAELLFKEMVCRFGQPEHIICDRDPRFTNRFFKT
ncbi:integrase, partial [Nocardia mangyaensis]|uniref:integrase n=1 Tax=Nocardia mangyaensis TaxID=2213200 RepID=UPI002674676E